MAIGFPTYGLLCPFCFFSWASLAHLLHLGFLIPFTNSAFPWAITNFIGLPWPNYFILILGVHELAINPLLSLFALLLGLQWPILTFLHHILSMGMLFLSFRASLRPFTSSRPICLFHEPVIHYSYHLGLMVLPLVCQNFASFVAGLSVFYLDPQKWPSTESFNLWRPHLIITLYYQTKTPISFWCRQRLNPKSLIQQSETLPIELTGTHIINMVFVNYCYYVSV